MLEVKIDDLPPAGAFGDNDGYEVSQGGVSRRMSGTVIKAKAREIAADEAQKAVEGISGGAAINDATPSASTVYSSAKMEGLRGVGVKSIVYLDDASSSNYTLQSENAGSYIKVDRTSAITITIPNDAIESADQYHIFTVRKVGAGAVTIIAEASGDTYEIADQGATVQILFADAYADIIGPGGVSLSLLTPN
jgi:hypothetical protein